MQTYIQRIKASNLFKDSFWAVFGNGIGYSLLLLSGILIARLLGRDLYGEYGLVKTTMFHIAAFATFGLGHTTTKFVAEFRKKDSTHIHSIVKSSMLITLISSTVLAILLFIFSIPLARFLNEPHLYISLRLLGCIVILKALLTTQQGILAGLGKFRRLAINTILSGGVMLILCIPLTYMYGLSGALSSLAISQFSNVVINYLLLHRLQRDYVLRNGLRYIRKLLTFSFPVALQELSYTISTWGSSLILVKYASLGEMGIYSATSQWNAIILFIPSLLQNVVLSHLSYADNQTSRHRTVYRMLFVNFCCTFFPLIVVTFLSQWISSFYGPSFVGMSAVLNVFILATIFQCISNVLQSELISQSKTWQLFFFRFIRDSVLLLSLFFLLNSDSIQLRGSMCYAISTLGAAILFFLILITYHKCHISTNK